MPLILLINHIRFYFFSNEHEPIHIHVTHAGRSCRVEIGTHKVTQIKGFNEREINKVIKLVKEHEDIFIQKWEEYFERE